MFIRKDLEDAIKNKFDLEKFIYKGTGKNTFNDFGLLMFDTDKGTIAIELGFYKNYYYIYKIKELPKQPELFSESEQTSVACTHSTIKLI